MRVALKVLVGVFAAIGVAYTALALYVYLFANCTFAQTPQAFSPDGRYFAVFEQRTCRDVDKSWSRVVLGKRESKERFVVVEGRATTPLGVAWGGSAELVVSYPRSASVKQLGTDGNWPRVTLRHSDD